MVYLGAQGLVSLSNEKENKSILIEKSALLFFFQERSVKSKISKFINGKCGLIKQLFLDLH